MDIPDVEGTGWDALLSKSETYAYNNIKLPTCFIDQTQDTTLVFDHQARETHEANVHWEATRLTRGVPAFLPAFLPTCLPAYLPAWPLLLHTPGPCFTVTNDPIPGVGGV